MGKKESQFNQVTVFSYDDHKKFLEDYYKIKKKEMPDKFSYYYLSKKAGFKNKSYFHNVIKGKQNLTIESIRKIAKVIPLTGRPYQYFETLVLFNQAKTEEERASHFEALKEFKEYIKARLINKNQDLYLLKWYYPVVREMIRWPGFQPKPNWIASKIKPNILVAQAQEALEVLIKLNLAKIDKEGIWQQDHPNLSTLDQGLGYEATHFHQQALNLSQESLKLPAEDRNISSMTMSLSPAHKALIRQKLYQFHKEIQGIVLKKLDKKSLKKYMLDDLVITPNFFEISEVWQFNIQTFKVADKKNKK